MYINSKFIYLEKHISQQMNKLWSTKMWSGNGYETTSPQALLSPTLFAYNHMKLPGYTSVVIGEEYE